MTSEQFMANFGHIASAPGGIGRLRDLIYHFAFSGELVAHSKETAAELAGVIAKAESPTGRTRRAMLEPAAGFYPIPPHWLWVNIGDVGHDWGQTKPSDDFTYIDVSAIDNKRGIVADGASIVSAANAPSRARKVVKRGTVIYSTIRPYLLNIAVIERDFDPAPIASTAFAILHPHDGVEAKFVYYFLRSPAFVTYVESVQSGIAYPAISDQKFFAASFPLPPTEEQRRIVAKVDELMAVCDQLEAQQQERQRRFPVLSRTCHAGFAEAPTPANLNRIFDETGDVSPDDLRKTILTLAVQGTLLSQNPNDESASNTLRSTKKPSPLSSNEIEKPPYTAPEGWIWLRIGSIFEVAGGIQKTPSREPRNNPHPYLGVGNVYRGRLDLSNIKQFELLPGELERRRLHSGDILIIEGNGSFNEIGRCAKWNGEIADCVHQNHVIRCRPCDIGITDFVLLFLNSPKGVEIMQRLAITSSGLYSLSVGKIRQIEIPLPPLAEQRRIVAKVDELMALVDQLEAQQQERDKLAEAFAKACVASFTGTAQLERPEKMKAPKTELVSVVTVGKKPKPDAEAPLAKLLSQNKGTLLAKSLWQQSGLPIDEFYQQLKTEIAQGWIAPPAEAEMKILEEA